MSRKRGGARTRAKRVVFATKSETSEKILKDIGMTVPKRDKGSSNTEDEDMQQ